MLVLLVNVPVAALDLLLFSCQLANNLGIQKQLVSRDLGHIIIAMMASSIKTRIIITILT